MFLFFKKKKIISQLILLIGFLLIIIPVGVNNFQKTGTYYLLPTHHQFYSYYHYFGHLIKANRLNISQTEAVNTLTNNEKKWRDQNNINLDKKEDYLKNIDYRNKVFFEETLKNPFYVIKLFVKKNTNYVYNTSILG